jgi:hypothetical protein
MEWKSNWTDPFQEYLKPFASLIGDRRTWRTLLSTVKGIIASGSVIGERIAACSEELSQSKDGAQRVLRMAKGKSTKRSELDAEELTARLRQVGVTQLQESEAEEVWLMADGSDLCKPYAQEMPYLMQVPDREQETGARLSHAHGAGSDAEAAQYSLSESHKLRGTGFSQ